MSRRSHGLHLFLFTRHPQLRAAPDLSIYRAPGLRQPAQPGDGRGQGKEAAVLLLVQGGCQFLVTTGGSQQRWVLYSKSIYTKVLKYILAVNLIGVTVRKLGSPRQRFRKGHSICYPRVTKTSVSSNIPRYLLPHERPLIPKQACVAPRCAVTDHQVALANNPISPTLKMFLAELTPFYFGTKKTKHQDSDQFHSRCLVDLKMFLHSDGLISCNQPTE